MAGMGFCQRLSHLAWSRIPVLCHRLPIFCHAVCMLSEVALRLSAKVCCFLNYNGGKAAI